MTEELDRGLFFVAADGRVLATAEAFLSELGNWSGLSPDGQLWYAAGPPGFIVTSTGEIRDLQPVLAAIGFQGMTNLTWASARAVTIHDGGMPATCDVTSLTCSEPVAAGEPPVHLSVQSTARPTASYSSADPRG